MKIDVKRLSNRFDGLNSRLLKRATKLVENHVQTVEQSFVRTWRSVRKRSFEVVHHLKQLASDSFPAIFDGIGALFYSALFEVIELGVKVKVALLFFQDLRFQFL